MFAIIAGLMAILVALAGLTCCFESSKAEKALAAMLSVPMLAFGNVQFSKGWMVGYGFAAMAAATLLAGGLPLLLSILLLWVGCAASWDDFQSEEIPTPVVVEEYLDDGDVAEMARRELAKSLAREAMAKLRIRELEAQLARANKPAAAELLDANEGLQEIFGTDPLDPRDAPHPNYVREIAYA
jgi:hypothetical protein